MTDRKRLLQTLLGVHSFYEKELTEFAILIWAEALAEFEIETAEAAFDRHVRDPDAGRFCPKPADILRQIRGDMEGQALMEWGKVLAAAQNGGKLFEGPTQSAIDSIGGMYALRMADHTSISFLQRQFLAAFKVYKARQDSPPLIESAVRLKRIGGPA